jgi:hypothetical protein
MTTADLTPAQRVQSLSLTYLKFRAGRLDWPDERVDAFLEQFKATCAEAGTTVSEALKNAAATLESAGRADLLPKAPT